MSQVVSMMELVRAPCREMRGQGMAEGEVGEALARGEGMETAEKGSLFNKGPSCGLAER